MRLPFAALVLILTTSAASADTIAGRAWVIDGDTIDIHGERIRLLDIDAPESNQLCGMSDPNTIETELWHCGQDAAQALSDWIGQRTVTCETTKKDRYKRWLARCLVANTDIAVWLGENGWAVPYRDCKCEVVRDASERAKAAKRGVWSGAFIMPWDWRAFTKP